MASLSSFENLECWKEAVLLRKEIRATSKTFPVEEKYRLTDQLIRASRSVTANIAEGFGRYHYQENTQFCRHSRESLNEIIDHLIVAHEENYIEKEQFEQLKQQANIMYHDIKWLHQLPAKSKKRISTTMTKITSYLAIELKVMLQYNTPITNNH